MGIYDSSSTTATISNNTVANLSNLYTGTSTGQIVGISVAAGVATVSGNTVRDLVTSSASTATTTGAALIGILNTSTTGITILSQNTVHTLVNSSAAAGAMSSIGI
ncbi:MAG: hypothetical protein IPP94_17530 [Ignavibacteria bacterium]|nr:hypothetical protein [Ignavibacteria bacterium]